MIAEHAMYKTLQSDLDIPETVDKRIENTLNDIKANAGKEKPVITTQKPTRVVRKVLLIAAVVATLSASVAVAAYIMGEDSRFYQAFFGNTIMGSQEAVVGYNEDGNIDLYIPQNERVEVDEELAEELVGKYLTNGGTFELNSYTGVVTTVTIENLLIDFHTGAFFFSMCMERESGGFPEFDLSGEWDSVWFKSDGGLVFSGEGWIPGEMYYDRVNSTENKIYLNCVGVNEMIDIMDESEMSFGFTEYVDIDMLNPEDLAKAKGIWEEDNIAIFELTHISFPRTESLPANEIIINDKPAVIFSAVGIRIYYDAFEFPAGYCNDDPGSIRYVALEYADGSRYVVADLNANIYNANYACGNNPELTKDGRTSLTFCFNRVIETEAIVKVIINDTVLNVQ